ncbi:TKL/DRK protein kinase [Phytophthora megakarya]|uniref:TKL/DRK protein kinase n=1 Tax=Phytophthora megakarya TaxID=4795 RepID=A0A225WX76_9STRA|nr:TKL/DRK protein kinase [Phytophthora megakarya]
MERRLDVLESSGGDQDGDGVYSRIATPDGRLDTSTTHQRLRSSSSSSSSCSRSSSASSKAQETSQRTRSSVHLLSAQGSATWQAHMDPRVDLKLLSNHFRDERMEESYQLYSSMVDFPVARRLMLALVAFEGAAYFLFHRFKDTCIAPSGNDYEWLDLLASLLDEQPSTTLNDTETSCVSFIEPMSKDEGLTWLIKLAYSLLMGVLAVLAAFAGIVAVAMKLDFTHVLLLAVTEWVTTLMLCFLGATPLISSSRRVMSNEAFLFFLCVFLPTCFTLTATYSEDRAARMAYASKVRAERINTTLKLDLSVKQIGLENRNAMTRDEKEALERALSATGDMELFMTVSIPFADLKLKEILAKTPNGEVLVGEYHQTDVVVKRLAQSCLTAEGLAAFKSKVELLACLRHPNIVLFIGATFDNLSNVGLVMEYLERGDVLSLLRSSITLTWSDPLLKIATDVAQGVSYLHNCDPPLVHRDLKSSNLLCTRTYSCKVSDFGESKRQLLPGKLFSTIVGTPYWLAPEILREERYDTQVDCYSFGVILVELETRHEPYHDLPKDYTTIDIMMGVSHTNPKRRPQMTEILYALQNEVRQELLDQNSTDVVSDKRRMVLMQQHQRLNRRGLQDLMRTHDGD